MQLHSKFRLLALFCISLKRLDEFFFKISSHDLHNVYVVVQFYPWFKFYLPLFLGMVMYDNEFETKENKI